MESNKIRDVLKPFRWIMGRWKSINAVATYPSMECPVKYSEDLSFVSTGHPMVNYSSLAWNPKDKSSMRHESGFLCIDKDESSIAFLVSSGTYGIASIEEGIIRENMMVVSTASIGHMRFVNERIVSVHRSYRLNENGQLEFRLMVQTAGTPLTEHLNAYYEKC